jgi:hypothetical protein
MRIADNTNRYGKMNAYRYLILQICRQHGCATSRNLFSDRVWYILWGLRIQHLLNLFWITSGKTGCFLV